LHNGKTNNDRQIINKQHAVALSGDSFLKLFSLLGAPATVNCDNVTLISTFYNNNNNNNEHDFVSVIPDSTKLLLRHGRLEFTLVLATTLTFILNVPLAIEILIAPVVTTTSIILCFNKHRLTQAHLENGR